MGPRPRPMASGPTPLWPRTPSTRDLGLKPSAARPGPFCPQPGPHGPGPAIVLALGRHGGFGPWASMGSGPGPPLVLALDPHCFKPWDSMPRTPRAPGTPGHQGCQGCQRYQRHQDTHDTRRSMLASQTCTSQRSPHGAPINSRGLPWGFPLAPMGHATMEVYGATLLPLASLLFTIARTCQDFKLQSPPSLYSITHVQGLGLRASVHTSGHEMEELRSLVPAVSLCLLGLHCLLNLGRCCFCCLPFIHQLLDSKLAFVEAVRT